MRIVASQIGADQMVCCQDGFLVIGTGSEPKIFHPAMQGGGGNEVLGHGHKKMFG
jgi:hypothetical protein